VDVRLGLPRPGKYAESVRADARNPILATMHRYSSVDSMIRWCGFFFLFVSSLRASGNTQLPTRFEPYEAGFLARAGAQTYFLTPTGALRMSPQLEMRLTGARAAIQPKPLDPFSGKSNYLRGSEPSTWRTGVPLYSRVRFAQVYPGVDLVYHGTASDLEYDFLVNPGASPKRIVLEFSGADTVSLDTDGNLLVRGDKQEVRFRRPAAYQQMSATRFPRSARYRLLGSHRVTLDIGPYDHRQPLLIDPVLSYAALWGTPDSNPISAIALDAGGNIYIAGVTTSPIPLVNPLQPQLGSESCSPQPTITPNPCPDIFVAKLNPSGAQILYSTYLSDNQLDVLGGLAVDAEGDAYIAATSYPPGPSAATLGNEVLAPSAGTGFVRKLNPTGSALLYSQSLGANTQANGIALDSSGNALVTGASYSNTFPSLNPIQAQIPVDSMLVTTNGGSAWNTVQTGALQVYGLAIPPGQSSTVYAATSSGLLKTTDSGSTWTSLIPSAFPATLVTLDPHNPSIVYAAYSVATGPPATLPSEAYPLSPAMILARSLDGGSTWTVLHLPSSPVPITSVAVDPENSSVLWVGVIFGGGDQLLRSGDGGSTWQTMLTASLGPGMETSLSTILIDSTNSSHVYACCINRPGSGVFITQNGGQSWVEGGAGPASNNAGFTAPVLDPANPSVLYATWSGGLLRSTDGGNTWNTVSIPMAPPNYYNVLIDPVAETIYVLDAGDLLTSTDGGNTWTVQQWPWVANSILLTEQSGTIYVSTPQTGIEHAFVTKLSSTGSTVWAMLLGGTKTDFGLAIAADAQGNAYVTGSTNSPDFPLANPLQSKLDKGNSFETDAFVAEISADGSKLVYSSYLGGSGADYGTGIGVDGNGNAWLAGSTESTDFPLMNPLEATGPPLNPFFLTQIAAGGQKLLFSTFVPSVTPIPLPASQATPQSVFAPGALVVDGNGNAWLGGQSTLGLPLVQAIQTNLPPAGTEIGGFLSEFASGGTLEFSTYLDTAIGSLAVTAGGSAWLAGSGNCAFFPVDFLWANSTAPPTCGGGGYLARIDPTPPAPQPGVPQIYAIYNAASYEVGDVVAPGEIVTIFGSGLASSAAGAPGVPLPLSLNGLTVTIGGTPAPLFYVSPGQINLQAPSGLSLGAASLVITVNGQTVTRAVNVVAVRPGIFVVTHASDFSLVTAQNPAQAGEYLALFATDLGPTSPSVPDGAAAPLGLTPLVGACEVYETGILQPAQYCGLAPETVGVYQVNFQLAPNMPSGLNVVWILLGSAGSSNQVPLYVQ
jgi:uncharacterized protein (TIGR03437 family)